MKNILSIASLVVGIIGISVFLNPVLEIICGGGGLLLTIFAKDKNASMVISGIRSWGQYLAWLNIFWVCLEFGLKLMGIGIF